MADATRDDDAGPLEPHLAALGSGVHLPHLAVAQCALRVGEAAPALRAMIAKAAEGERLSDDEKRLLLRGLFILADRRETETFPVFLRLLRRPEAELVDLLGDVLEVRLAPLLSGLFDGDTEALLGLTRDGACADDVRFSAIEAAAFLTFDGRIPRERMRAFLAGFVREPYAKGDVAWSVWADAIARLGLRDLAPLVHAALAEGRIARARLRKQQFDKDLAAAEANPVDATRFQDASYIADILEALEWTRAGEGYGEQPTVAVDAPIDVHLAQLGSAPRPPEVALRTCVARFEEAAPRLRGLLARAASGLGLTDEESLCFFRGLYVLAAVRDTVSCAPFLRFLRRPIEDVEDHIGDAVTASLPRFMISLFDGDEEALLGLATERKLDEYVRGAALEAATYLAWEGRLGRERLRRFLIDFHAKRRAGKGEFVWYAWMMAIALLDLGDLVPRVEAAWKGHLIDHSHLDWSDFKTDLARARTAWDDEGRFRSIGYADDVVAELAWTNNDDAYAAGPPEREPQSSSDMPVINPFRDVGRNAPCPCGSGKKYKKCCLASA